MRHVLVDVEKGSFFGWPANNGIWSWGNEIVVSYSICEYEEHVDSGHSVKKEGWSKHGFSRSLDGGKTWKREEPKGYNPDSDPVDLSAKIDFSHPELAIRCHDDKFQVSYDKCRTWTGPFPFGDFGFTERLTSRTDYLPISSKECLFFLSVHEPAVKAGIQDRSFCVRTDDGGMTFSLLGWMLREPFEVRSVMSSTVRTATGRLVAALRRRHDSEENGQLRRRCWVDVSTSADDGRSWAFLSKVADTDTPDDARNGNPPALVAMADGRLICAYGYRTGRRGMRARISNDEGTSWDDEIVLRDDARSWDFGYPRMVIRPDGKLVTVYYYTTADNPEQHIAATIWDPDTD